MFQWLNLHLLLIFNTKEEAYALLQKQGDFEPTKNPKNLNSINMSKKRYNKILFFQTEKGKFAIIEAPCQETVDYKRIEDALVQFGSVTRVKPHSEGGEYSYLLNFYHKDVNDYGKFIYNENVFAPAEAIAFLSDLPLGYWEQYVSELYSMSFTLKFLCINTARKNVLIKYTDELEANKNN